MDTALRMPASALAPEGPVTFSTAAADAPGSLDLIADDDDRVVRLAGTEFGHSAVVQVPDVSAARGLAQHVLEVMARYTSYGLVLGPLIDSGEVRRMLSLIGAVQDDDVPSLRFGPDRRMQCHLSDNRLRGLRRLGNLLNRDGRDVRYQQVRHWDAAYVEQLRTIRRSRLLAHTASHALEDDRRWCRWMENLLATGRGRIEAMFIDERMAAYCVTGERGTSRLVYEGFHDERDGRYGPGRLLETEIVRDAMASHRCTEVDWMTSTSPESLLAFNNHYRTVKITVPSRDLCEGHHAAQPVWARVHDC